MDYRYYELSRKETLRYYFAGSVAAAALGFLFYHSLLPAMLAPLATIPLKGRYAAHLASRRRITLAMQFKDLLTSLSASFAVGRQMKEALLEAKENLRLIYDDNAPIMEELELMTTRLTKGLEGERQVLFDFADRSACEDIAGFVDVYFTCLTTGGDRIHAVRRASDIILDKIDIRNDIMALTAQKKFEVKILAALPPLIILFLLITSPDYLEGLYGSFSGNMVMSAALAAMLVAFYWSSRITDIEV